MRPLIDPFLSIHRKRTNRPDGSGSGRPSPEHHLTGAGGTTLRTIIITIPGAIYAHQEDDSGLIEHDGEWIADNAHIDAILTLWEEAATSADPRGWDRDEDTLIIATRDGNRIRLDRIDYVAGGWHVYDLPFEVEIEAIDSGE